MHNEGILGDKSYELLDLLRRKRNKIHEMGTVFSEKELQEFSMAYSTAFYIYTYESPQNIGTERRTQMRNWVERSSEELLKIIKE